MIEMSRQGFALMRCAPGLRRDELAGAAAKVGITAEECGPLLCKLLDNGMLRFRADGTLEEGRSSSFSAAPQSSEKVKASLDKALGEVNALIHAAWAHGFSVDMETMASGRFRIHEAPAEQEALTALINQFEKAVERASNEMDGGGDYAALVRAEAERDRLKAELTKAVETLLLQSFLYSEDEQVSGEVEPSLVDAVQRSGLELDIDYYGSISSCSG